MMKHFHKAVLLAVRYISYRFECTKTYYWAEKRIFTMRKINLLPDKYYCFMYRFCMLLVNKKKFIKMADWMIHRIPYNVRCNLA